MLCVYIDLTSTGKTLCVSFCGHVIFVYNKTACMLSAGDNYCVCVVNILWLVDGYRCVTSSTVLDSPARVNIVSVSR